jgi:hypothetical protein
MPFEKVEFSLPESDSEVDDNIDIEIEPSEELVVGEEKPDEDDGFEIEVVDDTPKADRGRKASDPPDDVTEEELGEYSDKVQKRIKHFSKGYHDERRAKELALRERQELERLAQQLVEENKTLKGTVDKNQEALLDQAKQTIESELSQAKRVYKEAYEAGDSDAVIEAQDILTNVKIKADKLNNIRLPSLQDNELPVDLGEVETNIAPVQVDERANEWASANPWFGSDDEMTSYVLGLHSKLVKTGVNPQSDSYYETIDARMRKMFPEEFEGEVKPKRQANVVAPATRSTAPKKVTLSQTQVNLAKRLGVSLKDYATQVALEMRKQNG